MERFMITLTREEAQQVLHSLLNYPMTEGKAIQLLRAKLKQPEQVIQARKEGDLIVVDLPQVPTGSGGIHKEPEPVAYINVEERKLEWAHPIRWETPTVVKMDKVPLYITPPSAPIPKMREMLDVQGSDGNWNYDRYMHGMYNGMEYMLAMVESREPVFREATKNWLSKREWQGLTDEEVGDIGCDFASLGGDIGAEDWFAFYLAIETKLKEKNNG